MLNISHVVIKTKLVSCLTFGSCIFSFSKIVDDFKYTEEKHIIKSGAIEINRTLLSEYPLAFNGLYIGGIRTIALYQMEDSGLNLESHPFIKIKFSKLGKIPFSAQIILKDKYRNVIIKSIPNISVKTHNATLILNILAPGSIGSGDFLPNKVFDIEFIFNQKAAKNVMFTLESISVHKSDPRLKLN